VLLARFREGPRECNKKKAEKRKRREKKGFVKHAPKTREIDVPGGQRPV